MSTWIRWGVMGCVGLTLLLAGGTGCETTPEGGTAGGRCNRTHVVRTPFVARDCGTCELPQGHSGRHRCDACGQHF